MRITICETCGLKYPAKRGQCPQCDGPPKADTSPEAVWQRTLKMLRSMSDTDVRYIYQKPEWKQGNARMRQACLDEFDRRFGLENWPEFVSKEI